MKSLFLRQLIILFIISAIIISLAGMAYQSINNDVLNRNLTLINQGPLTLLTKRFASLPPSEWKTEINQLKTLHQPTIQIIKTTKNFINDYPKVAMRIGHLGYAIEFNYSKTMLQEMSFYGYWIKTTLLSQIKHSPEKDWQQILNSTSNEFGYPITLIQPQALPHKNQIQQELNTAGIGIDLPDDGQDNSVQVIYLKIPNSASLIKVGPIYLPVVNRWYIYLLIGSVILAIILCALLLSIPLSKQIKKITSLTQAYSSADFSYESKLPKFALLRPLYQNIIKMGDALNQLLSTQKDLSMAIAHELRTPLSRIRFQLETIKKQLTQKSGLSKAEGIDQDIDELEELINELINYSKIDWQQFNEEKASCNLTEILNEIFIRSKQSHLEKKLALESPKEILSINAHPSLLKIVISNLIENACKYGKNKIHITLKKLDETIQLSVSDDANPIKKEDYKKVFEPFIRLSNQKSGFGLGLMSVKKILALHEGTITLKPSKLGGNEFVITLPH